MQKSRGLRGFFVESGWDMLDVHDHNRLGDSEVQSYPFPENDKLATPTLGWPEETCTCMAG